ncbi:MAG: hypothetical protein LBV00_06215, partial [Propionibacteriaceae bacterium]|nr:hypothetical protein [Propionibacteriaceae bacterium]
MNSDPLSESNPVTGNGNRPVNSATAWVSQVMALLRMVAFSVHPVAMSVIVRVRAYSPRATGP